MRKRTRDILPTLMAVVLAATFAVISATCAVSSVVEGNDATEPEKPVETAQDAIEEGRVYGDDVPATEPCVMVEEDPEDPLESENIEAALLAKATRIDNVRVTHYCSELYPHICGTGTGITASGRMIQPYVSVAVDPKVIPLGSDVLVDYGDGVIHYYRADDVGGAVDGHHIDVAVTTHDEALALGVKRATVWWVGADE